MDDARSISDRLTCLIFSILTQVTKTVKARGFHDIPVKGLYERLADCKRVMVLDALLMSKFNVAAAAESLLINKMTVYNLIEQFGIQLPTERVIRSRGKKSRMLDRALIERALKPNGRKISIEAAAKSLNITRSMLARNMKRHGIVHRNQVPRGRPVCRPMVMPHWPRFASS